MYLAIGEAHDCEQQRGKERFQSHNRFHQQVKVASLLPPPRKSISIKGKRCVTCLGHHT